LPTRFIIGVKKVETGRLSLFRIVQSGVVTRWQSKVVKTKFSADKWEKTFFYLSALKKLKKVQMAQWKTV